MTQKKSEKMKYLTVGKIFGNTADKLNLTDQDSRLDRLQLSVSSWNTFPIALSYLQFVSEPTLHYRYMTGTKIAFRP
jgi:hypothetical protein